MTPLVAIVLLLQPVLPHDADVRLAAAGTGAERITWTVDGTVDVTTADREATTLRLEAGLHTILAESAAHGPWTAMARTTADGPGLELAPAWSASSAGEPRRPIVQPAAGVVAMALAAAAVARRHSKGP